MLTFFYFGESIGMNVNVGPFMWNILIWKKESSEIVLRNLRFYFC
jgi:hypothetical protein